MLSKLSEIKERAEKILQEADSLEKLNELRVKTLGRKGEITVMLRSLKDLSPEIKAQMGQAANQFKMQLEEMINQKSDELKQEQLLKRLQAETIDVTLPGLPLMRGSKHPLTRVYEEIRDIFVGMGFNIAEGPEIELDYYNFEALNVPRDHPARDL